MSDDDRLVRVIRAVQRGTRWLKGFADGAQEPSAVAVAISALIAAERNQHSQFVRRLVRRLLTQQLANGSWNDELWDTAHVVRALTDVRDLDAATAIQKAVRFFKVTQDPLDGTWYEDPSETLLVLDLLLELDSENFSLYSEQPLRWLLSLQRPDGLIIATRYTGMAVSLFLKLRHMGPEYAVAVDRGLEHLTAVIRERGMWTSASWSNYYPLRAFLDADAGLELAVVGNAVEWFLQHQNDDGRWLQVAEIHDTAMAVTVLSRLLQAPLVDVTPPQVAVLQVNKENGTLRVAFSPPGAGAVLPSERLKISESVRAELGVNQQKLVATIGRVSAAARSTVAVTAAEESRTKSSCGRSASIRTGISFLPRYKYCLRSHRRTT